LVINSSAYTDFTPFLLANRLPQCYLNPSQPRLARSYYVPPTYFPNVSPDQRIRPGPPKTPLYIDFCQKVVSSGALDDYEFQTETMLASTGCNIYDFACWQIAVSLKNYVNEAVIVQREILDKGQTCEFPDIRGDAPCKGVLVEGECPEPSGNCGFCYGVGSNAQRSLLKSSAWTFRMISDYWAFQGTVDQRCPEKNVPWTWNDYRPVLGENAWAFLIAPLQVAFIKYGSVANIPPNDLSLSMALNILPSFVKMCRPNGGVAFSPNNTLNGNRDSGYDVSTENNASLLGGLKMLRYILTTKGIYLERLAEVNLLIDSIERYIKSSYDPVNQFFRQGGTYYNPPDFQWSTDFAVDCQTWVMSVINPLLIDQWFGTGTSNAIWQKTKALGGFNCNAITGYCDGLGFSYNTNDRVFSGEWTLGGVNMLRIFAREYSNPAYLTEATFMRDAIESQLRQTQTIDGVPVIGLLYANKRYFIPFGWWANPVLSTASSSWAIMADNDYNPFYLGGEYRVNY